METMTECEQIDEVLANETPAGRFQAVVDMLNEGRITPSQALEMLDMPEMTFSVRIEPGPWNLDADLRERLAGASDAPSADQPRSEHRSKAFGYVDTNISRALCAADNERILESPQLMSLARLPTPRPDGFDQHRIDEIKAALLAPATKRRS